MKKNTRGFIETALAIKLVLILLAGGYAAKQTGIIFADKKPKQEAIAAKAEAEKSAALALESEKKAKELAAALTAERQAHKEKESVAAGFVAGTGVAIEAQDLRVAKIMNDNAARSLDPVTVKQLLEMTEIVKDLIARNADTSKALEEKKAEIATVKTNLALKESDNTRLVNENRELQTKVVASTKKTEELTTIVEKKTGDNVSLWDRLKALAVLSGIALLAFVVLYIRHHGVYQSMLDGVQFQEDTYKKAKTFLDSDKFEAFKKEVNPDSWFEGDYKSKKLYDKARKILRL